MVRGFFVCFIFFFSACFFRPSQSEAPISESGLPTSESSATAEASIQSPAESFPKLVVSDLPGEIWIRRHAEENFLLVYDFVIPVPTLYEFPEECEWPPGANYLICESNETYLFFPETSERITLSPSKLEWISVSLDARWLTFPHEEADKIYAFDVGTGNLQEIQNDAFTGIYNSLPIFSSDGSYVAWENFVPNEGSYLVVMDIQDGTIQRLGIEVSICGDLSWSPVENVLVFGEYLGNSDVGQSANQVSLFNPGDGNVEVILAVGDTALLHCFGSGEQIWSPDGQKITISSGSELCILSIVELDTECISFEEVNHIVGPTWSPDGSKLIFHYESPTEDALVLYDLVSRELNPLLNEISAFASFDWNKTSTPPAGR
jgi:hypothetical protein